MLHERASLTHIVVGYNRLTISMTIMLLGREENSIWCYQHLTANPSWKPIPLSSNLRLLYQQNVFILINFYYRAIAPLCCCLASKTNQITIIITTSFVYIFLKARVEQPKLTIHFRYCTDRLSTAILTHYQDSLSGCNTLIINSVSTANHSRNPDSKGSVY